ncbi:MAG: glycosyltransferase [Candidatus Helarchaeota archaeon]
MNKITAVLCYKGDEEIPFLEACLAHIAPFFDEIVVVLDRNECKKSLGIVSKYGCKIVQYKFIGDFSEMRNVGIEASSSPWIFTVDVDEYIEHGLLYRMHEIIAGTPYDGRAFKRINFVGDTFINYPDWHLRIFRKKYRYFGRVHESVNVPKEKIYYDPNFHIVHLKSRERQEKQSKRYKKLMQS